MDREFTMLDILEMLPLRLPTTATLSKRIKVRRHHAHLPRLLQTRLARRSPYHLRVRMYQLLYRSQKEELQRRGTEQVPFHGKMAIAIELGEVPLDAMEDGQGY